MPVLKVMHMRVLITGGSEGIGYAFARYYASKHAEVIITAKREDLLKKAAAGLKQEYDCSVSYIVCDLSVKDSALHIYRQVRDIDILINNAGFGFQGKSWDIPLDKEEDMILVNCMAVMDLTKLYVKDMIRKGKGRIINVCSTGAFQPGPYIAGYYASKSFVLSYTRAVREEVREYGIHVSALCPGPVDTAFYDKSGGHMSMYHMNPDQVVKYAVKHQNQAVIIPGIGNKLMRIIPVSLRMKCLKHMKK